MTSLATLLQAQGNRYDPHGVIHAQLEPLIRAKLGERFLFEYVPLDSVIGRGPIEEKWEDITDPYGTLKGSILFWAKPESNRELENDDFYDSSVVGVFNNGEILWHTGPVCRGGVPISPGQLVHTGDINRDGEVDILMVSEELFRRGDRISFLWIFSWNGQRGRIVNDIGADGQSVIIGTDGMYDLFDIDDDGIVEIQTEWLRRDDPYGGGLFPENNPSPKAPCVTYGWNGSLYGYWPHVPQVGCHEFFPANRLSVSVQCKVTKTDGVYDYSYTWTNEPTSKQKIADIWIANIKTNAAGRGPTGYQWQGVRYVHGFNWNLHVGKRNLLKPGQSSSAFGLASDDLPRISIAYVQGYRPFASPLDHQGNDVHTDEMVRNDIVNNSVIRYTLGPADPPSPFVPLAFLDSLISYKHQALALDWIKNQGITNSLDQKLENARSLLEKKNNQASKNILHAFLNEVEAQKDKHLTSEAYALLKFNAEYLISKL